MTYRIITTTDARVRDLIEDYRAGTLTEVRLAGHIDSLWNSIDPDRAQANGAYGDLTISDGAKRSPDGP